MYQRGGTIVPRKERIRRSSALMANDPFTFVVAVDADVSCLFAPLGELSHVYFLENQGKSKVREAQDSQEKRKLKIVRERDESSIWPGKVREAQNDQRKTKLSKFMLVMGTQGHQGKSGKLKVVRESHGSSRL